MSFFEAGSIAGGKLRIAAGGKWTVTHASEIEDGFPALLKTAGKAGDIVIDLAGVEEFDTYGAWLLERLTRELRATGCTVKISGARSQNEPLLDQVKKTSDQPGTPENTKIRSAGAGLQIRQSLAGIFSDAAHFMTMLGALLSALFRMIRHPGLFRVTSAFYQFDRVCWKALPIVLVVTFIIGVIIAQQGFFHFRRFGADLYVVDMIGFLIMREIGVLLVAIVVAGRSGSSYTAELGSMKMREEIDALKTMGFDPVDVLILPRVLVLVIGLPVLTFLGSMAALLGSGLVATTYAGMTTELFMDRLNEAISMDHFLVGLIKAPFIGLVIGIIACVEGLRVRGSALSLGRHTTQSVVKSIFMVIMLDGLFALFFSAIEM